MSNDFNENEEMESQMQESQEAEEQKRKTFAIPEWQPVRDVDDGDWDF